MNIRKTFCKEERLYKKKDIDFLFKKGKRYYFYPYIFLVKSSNNTDNYRSKVIISVSKKIIKSAVKRNRVKRIIRESFRDLKNDINTLLEQKGKYIHIAILYKSCDLPNLESAKNHIKLLIEKLNEYN